MGLRGTLPGLSGSQSRSGSPAQPGKVEGLVALVMGDFHSTPPLVRIHSQCLTGDVFGSLRCDCRCNELALGSIAAEGAGILAQRAAGGPKRRADGETEKAY